MALHDAVELIMVLIAVWTLYVARRAAPPSASKKNLSKQVLLAYWSALKNKFGVSSMLNIEEKKSGSATRSSTYSKKARGVHVLCSEKKVWSDTLRIAFSKKALGVNNCGQKKNADIAVAIKNVSVSGIPLKKSRVWAIFGRLKKSLRQAEYGLSGQKSPNPGVYA